MLSTFDEGIGNAGQARATRIVHSRGRDRDGCVARRAVRLRGCRRRVHGRRQRPDIVDRRLGRRLGRRLDRRFGGDDNEDREFSDDPFSPDAAIDDYPTSPMSEFFGYEDMDSDEQEQRYRQEEMDRQQVIAECMRLEGFEYTVFVYDQSFSFESPYQDMTRREYVEKYGFGISTMFEDGFAPPEASPDEEEINPNDEYVNGLSEAEQEAYYEALYGPPDKLPMEETVGTDGEPVEVEYEYVPQGCDGKAYEEQSPPEDQEFMEDISALMSTEIYERAKPTPVSSTRRRPTPSA